MQRFNPTLFQPKALGIAVLWAAFGAAGLVQAGSQSDFDGDGVDDLAIGAPGENLSNLPPTDLQSLVNAGAVNVLYGKKALGLSALKNQLWEQNSPGILGAPNRDDQFGAVLVTGDFNRDGASDLVVGVPNEGLSTATTAGPAQAGAINVIYGLRRTGLLEHGNQVWHQDVAGIDGAAESLDHFGSALAAADFNGDGFDDVAVGVPDEAVGSAQKAGAVNVIYGGVGGLTAAGSQLWHREVADVEGDAVADEGFGRTLSAGDFNGDGFADLAVGVPGQSFPPTSVDGPVTRPNPTGTGAVQIFYGSAAGLSAAGNQIWHQDLPDVPGEVGGVRSFGAALAVGDFNRDGQDDLAIGAPGGAFPNGLNASFGEALVLYGSASGLSAVGAQLWHQDVPGIQDNRQSDDEFGAALTAADLDGDGFDDLAVGVPGEDIGGVSRAGAVNLIFGSSSGLAATGAQLLHQGVVSLGANPVEAGDRFGASLTAGDFDGDGVADLAIGVEREALGGLSRAGLTHVVYGNANRILGLRAQLWHQDSEEAVVVNGVSTIVPILGKAEAEDRFGAALAASGRSSARAPLAVAGFSGEWRGASRKCQSTLVNPALAQCRIVGRLLVTNPGTLPAAASEVHFFLSRDAIRSDDDVAIGVRALDELAAGARSVVRFSELGTLRRFTSGRNVLLAVLDATDVVQEANEDNNVVAVQLNVP